MESGEAWEQVIKLDPCTNLKLTGNFSSSSLLLQSLSDKLLLALIVQNHNHVTFCAKQHTSTYLLKVCVVLLPEVVIESPYLHL